MKYGDAPIKFRKKPVVIEAMQFTEDNKNQVFNWITGNCCPAWDANGNPALKIETLEGDMIAQLGDWIIKGVKNEFYPCKADIFDATYEAAEATTHTWAEYQAANKQALDDIAAMMGGKRE